MKKALDFTYDTPFEKGLKLSTEAKKHKYNLVIFLRYFGCTSCQLDMIDLAEAKPAFDALDARVFVVLQSDPAIVAEGIDRFHLPFDIICDPKADLYKLYEVASAGSKEALMAGVQNAAPEDAAKFQAKIARMQEMKLEHGQYEGDEYQLPGYFLLDSDMNLLEEHRAASMVDMPLAEDYIAKIKAL